MRGIHWKKCVGFTALGVVICLGSYLFIKNVVFGSYTAGSPMIVAGSVANSGIMTTEQGDAVLPASKPAIISGGALNNKLPEIPTAIGDKGSATNPFVLLEIVPDKSLQTLSYICSDSEPFDLSELSESQTLIDSSGNYSQNWRNNLKSFFNISWQYEGVLFPSDYANALNGNNNKGVAKSNPTYKNQGEGPAFSVSKVFECDASSFDDPIFNGYTDEQLNAYKAEHSGNAYDFKFKSVDAKQKAATQNWYISATSGKFVTKSGYYVFVGDNNGSYRYDNGSFTVQGNSNQLNWNFVETKPTTGSDLTAAYNSDKNTASNNHTIGNYIKMDNAKIPLKHYQYFELVNNDALKHMIFRFDAAADYKNFHMKVIPITPEELNEMSLYDNASTMDYIERADMYYVQDATRSADNFAQEDLNIYLKYALHQGGTKTVSDIEGFKEGHDIEWGNCLKIIQRLADDPCLPMLYGTSLGMQGNLNYTAHTYYSNNTSFHEEERCKNRASALSNVMKMYLVSTQFDLLARKSDGVELLDNSGKQIDGSTFYPNRTFMDDIFPKLMQAQLTNPNGSSYYTGYYSREQCSETSVSSEEKEKANYLWNQYTFVPPSLGYTMSDLLNSDKLRMLGYSQYITKSIFAQDGDIGKLAMGRPVGAEYGNVLGVGATTGAENKWMVKPDIFNETSTVLYEILNGLFLKAKPLEVTVTGAIVDPDDTTVGISSAIMFVDYDKKASYNTGIKIGIDFTIRNRNNLDGVMNISAVNSDTGVSKALKVHGASEAEIIVPAGTEVTSSAGVKSTTPKVTKYHLDLSLEDWLAGYDRLKFKGIGYHKFEGLPRKKAYSTYTLNINQRDLFNLE